MQKKEGEQGGSNVTEWRTEDEMTILLTVMQERCVFTVNQQVKLLPHSSSDLGSILTSIFAYF